MYIYIYIYIYIHIYIYIYLYLFIYIYIYKPLNQICIWIRQNFCIGTRYHFRTRSGSTLVNNFGLQQILFRIQLRVAEVTTVYARYFCN
jgi:hypothetical protein